MWEAAGPVAIERASAAAPTIDRWQPLIAEASRRFDVPEQWIREVMRIESGGRATTDGRPTVSRAGAMGLMQVMPRTYDELRRRHGLGGDPHDPRDNILAGTAYLREMWACFGMPGAFAAYHAGPARLGEYLSSGRPLPRETQHYLARLGVRLDPASVGPAAPSECEAAGERPAPADPTTTPDRRRTLLLPRGLGAFLVPHAPSRPGP